MLRAIRVAAITGNTIRAAIRRMPTIRIETATVVAASTDGADSQYGARLEQRDSPLLNEHQRHEDLAAEEGASEQTPCLNDLREATRKSQESGWHERWQRHQQAG